MFDCRRICRNLLIAALLAVGISAAGTAARAHQVMVIVKGDKATVTTLLDGLKQPTEIEPSGETLWVGNRGAEKTNDMIM